MQSVPGITHTKTIPAIGTVYFNAQQHFLTISEDLRCTYSFDPEGRFMSGFFAGVNYRRNLQSDIMMKYFAASKTKTRRFLSVDENRALVDDVLARVEHIRKFVWREDDATIRRWVDTILTWNFTRLQAERTTFQSIYKPISILPPDQYLSIVLQAAEGCSWNKCTFCTLYHDRKFRIKAPQEFRQHARQVKAFLGRSIGLRKSIFLADANALIIRQQRLIDLLKVVHEEFPLGCAQAGEDYTLKGIYAFLDIFGADRKTLADYQELKEYGVKRIYIGLETGDDELFMHLNKPGAPEACVEAVRTIKAAGINVGVILLAGAGGQQFAQQHVDHSLQRISEMPLGQGDLVYISPLVVAGNDAYSQQMQALGVRALDNPAVMAQVTQLKSAFKAMHKDGAKVALYHIEEFMY